jgi:hypothetical protein
VPTRDIMMMVAKRSSRIRPVYMKLAVRLLLVCFLRAGR